MSQSTTEPERSLGKALAQSVADKGESRQTLPFCVPVDQPRGAASSCSESAYPLTSRASYESRVTHIAKMHFCRWLDCKQAFNSEIELHDHVISDHFESRSSTMNMLPTLNSTTCKWTTKPHSSDVCLHTYKTRTSFKDHIVRHFSSYLKPLKCLYCPLTFRNRQRLRAHELEMHFLDEGPSPKTPKGVNAHLFQIFISALSQGYPELKYFPAI